jgi:hypothetical protein
MRGDRPRREVQGKLGAKLASHFRRWHSADIDTDPENVRFEG